MQPVARLRRPRILLVDDHQDDRFLIQRALEKQAPAPEVEVVTSGEEALERLQRAPAPDLVLMDVQMPGMGGLACLEALRANPATEKQVVTVFTNSDHAADIARAYAAHANAYVQKPNGFQQLQDTLRDVCSMWFQTALLPDAP